MRREYQQMLRLDAYKNVEEQLRSYKLKRFHLLDEHLN